ncbi:amino acid ABC transporter substrate-binding protein [Anaeromyxobacter oryzae]|uniref:Ethanolamine utilization protein EutJ n=1 Tax=Anaeromyxobacter oryzae TaxID=2918170 RepID=A0ABM7X110_9BACT|nr:amino acid ABC transporter substrate-binding protein [Anaeromyxobacter oryzae]BDG05491.1 ethanolamine utilization protein EutJ [Anaeromyxobacter oryzae]
MLPRSWIHRWSAPLLVVVAALGAGTGCKSRSSQAEKKELRIGATLPLTGAESRIGGFYKEGYDLAFEEVNRQGGLQVGDRKLPVTLVLLDDTSTQATAVSLADRLVNSDKVDFLLGTYASHLVEAQSTVAEQNKMPYVNGGGGATDIYKRGYKYVFGLLAPVELLGNTLMQFVDEQEKAGKLPRPSRIALVWENTAHGKDFRRGVQDFVNGAKGGYEIVVDESFELSGKDFGALLGKVKASNADLFLADAHLPDYITMQRQYVSAGLCNKVISYGARGSEKGAVDALGQENVNGILSAVWWSAQLAAKGGPAKAFVDAFKAKYAGRAPEWYQALGYETARALFTAIQQAGSTDREAVRSKLAALQMDSILPGGKLSFAAEHGQQAYYPFVVQQNMPDGTSPIVFPPVVATGQGIVPNPRCAR